MGPQPGRRSFEGQKGSFSLSGNCFRLDRYRILKVLS